MIRQHIAVFGLLVAAAMACGCARHRANVAGDPFLNSSQQNVASATPPGARSGTAGSAQAAKAPGASSSTATSTFAARPTDGAGKTAVAHQTLNRAAPAGGGDPFAELDAATPSATPAPASKNSITRTAALDPLDDLNLDLDAPPASQKKAAAMPDLDFAVEKSPPKKTLEAHRPTMPAEKWPQSATQSPDDEQEEENLFAAKPKAAPAAQSPASPGATKARGSKPFAARTTARPASSLSAALGANPFASLESPANSTPAAPTSKGTGKHAEEANPFADLDAEPAPAPPKTAARPPASRGMGDWSGIGEPAEKKQAPPASDAMADDSSGDEEPVVEDKPGRARLDDDAVSRTSYETEARSPSKPAASPSKLRQATPGWKARATPFSP